MAAALVMTPIALGVVAALLPGALAALAERQPWPPRVRLTRAAHLVELATEGSAAVTILEGRVVAVGDGETRPHVLIALPDGDIERLVLAAPTSPADLRRLRHWRAELIPILVVAGTTVDPHGPSGVVGGERLLALDARR